MEANTNKLNLPAIAFALAALVCTVPSAANAGDGPATEKVPYADLNLATSEGIEELDRRLDRAVMRVCGETYPRPHAITTIAQCKRVTKRDLKPQREYAIARANGNADVQWAQNAVGN